MNTAIKSNKTIGLVLFGIIYVFAYLCGFIAGSLTDIFLLKMLIFDLAATFVIWVISLLLHNSSLYDAYWSLTPVIMMICGIRQYFNTLNSFHYIFIAALLLWAVRLTANWITTFENLSWEDWRYKKYRELPALLWHVANLFGIMLIPTIFVFLGIVPVFYFMTIEANALSLIGSAVVLSGTVLEFFADRQMHRYLRKAAEKKTCRTGLWQYSRHPNYLGEILIWLGAYLALICTDISYWYLITGVVAMIFLFLVISVPLAEKRQLMRRSDYAAYRSQVSVLLLLPPKHKGNSL